MGGSAKIPGGQFDPPPPPSITKQRPGSAASSFFIADLNCEDTSIDCSMERMRQQLQHLQGEVSELRQLIMDFLPLGTHRSTQRQSRRPSRQQSSLPPLQPLPLKEHPPPEAVEAALLTCDEAFHADGGHREIGRFRSLSERLQGDVCNPQLAAVVKDWLPTEQRERLGYGVALVNQPFVSDLDELCAHAHVVHPRFDEAMASLSHETNAVKHVPGVKEADRAELKGHVKYREGAGKDVAWYRMTDLVRGTLGYDSIESMYHGLEHSIKTFGPSVREFNDRYQRPMEGGYRDLQLVVEFRVGDVVHLCEVQLNTRAMMRAKAATATRGHEVVQELATAITDGDPPRCRRALKWAEQQLTPAADGGAALRPVLRTRAARTLLHDAAGAGHAAIVRELLRHGADPDAVDMNGDTALHLAVAAGHEGAVWALLSHQPRPGLDIVNRKGESALVQGCWMLWQRPPEAAVRAVLALAHAAGVERVAQARDLVDREVARRMKPSRVLVDSAAAGNLKKVEGELRQCADPKSERDGVTAMQAACSNGHVDVVECLLRFGGTVGQAHAQTLFACNWDAVRCHRVFPVLAGVAGNDAMEVACGQGDLGIVESLMESGVALTRDHAETLFASYWNMARSHRVFPVLVSVAGNEAMEAACSNGDLDNVATLIESGVALSREHAEVLFAGYWDVVCSHRLFSELVTIAGDQAMDAACANGNLDVIEDLVNSGRSMTQEQAISLLYAHQDVVSRHRVFPVVQAALVQ